jgi:hypothetical protein
MNDLQAVQAYLGTAMLADTRLALANVVAWLDPLHLADDVEQDLVAVDYDDTDNLHIALAVCRRCFPHVYAEAMQLIWHGTDDLTLSRLVRDGINAGLVAKLGSLDDISYGPPIEGMGVCLDDGEFYEAFPDLAAIAADFGLNPDNAFSEVLAAHDVARRLVESLEATTSITLRHVAQLLTWLFSMSGNTLVDMSMDDIWESGMEMPDWSPEDIALVNEMTLEAIQILDEAALGQQALAADSELRTALQQNIQRITARLERSIERRNTNDHKPICLQWPERS